jgi:hypothetical protein
MPQGQVQRAHAVFTAEALEEADFALSEDQDAPRAQIFIEAGKGETGLLDVRAGDPSIEAARTGQQFERQADLFRPPVQQRADGDARRWGHWTI